MQDFSKFCLTNTPPCLIIPIETRKSGGGQKQGAAGGTAPGAEGEVSQGVTVAQTDAEYAKSTRYVYLLLHNPQNRRKTVTQNYRG